MLRAKPTQIGLNTRDLDWHHVRHNNHQAQRARGQPVRVVTTSFPDNPSPPQMDEALLPYRFPRPPTKQLSPIRGQQVPIFSTDQDMHQYWSGIMANAGGLSQVQLVSSGRPTMISASPSSRSTFHASRASFESEDGSTQHFDDDDGEGPNYITHPRESDEVFEDGPQPTFGSHSPHQDTTESDEKDEDYPHQSSRAPRRRRLSFSFYRRRAPRRHTSTLDQTSLLHLPTQNADMDGSSDRHNEFHSTYSTTHSQYTTALSSISDDHADAQQLSASPTNSRQTDRGVAEVSELLTSTSLLRGNPELPTSTSLPHSRQVTLVQRRESGTLPRSPLYIAEAAASSSSPEKRPRSTFDAIDLSEDFEDLSLHPRRAKRYKRRSHTYPWVQSEADPGVYASEHDGSSQDVYHSILSDLPIPNISVPDDNQPRHLSPRASNFSLRPLSHASSATSMISLNRSSPSPSPPPYTPQKSPAQPSPPHPLPSHPFSAVRRTVSFASPSPSYSLSPSPSRPNIQTPSPNSNSLPNGSPRTPPYTVYNDRLPASTQPQTPVGLPRNGIPDGGLPGVRYGGAYTAPVGGGRRSLRGLRDGGNRGVAGSPTRRGTGMIDQENARHGHEIERRWMRQALMGMMDGNEEDGVIDEED